MHVEVTIPPRHELLAAVRGILSGATESLLCVAFANQAGVHLVEPHLRERGGGVRLLATTVFGSTTPAALNDALSFGTQVRIYNPRAGTYHPKLYLSRKGEMTEALVGSANLTTGLLRNVEIAALLCGPSAAPPLAALWQRAEELWAAPTSTAWEPLAAVPAAGDTFTTELWELLRTVVQPGVVVGTVTDDRPNTITDVTATGLWIETERTRGRGTGPQVVPAWMFNTAWDYLVARGRLSNTTLLRELNVHRSSAVCAVLARIPGVAVVSRRPIELALSPDARPLLAAEEGADYDARG